MANEPIITVVGNITADPELRFTPSGAAVCNFTVASTPRNKVGDSWEDGEPLFIRCDVWREYAENAAESLSKGMRVVVTGRLVTRTYEHNGDKRSSLELHVDAIGPELRWATARVNRAERTGGGQPRQSAKPANNDPWAQPAPSQGADPWAQPASSDEPPF